MTALFVGVERVSMNGRVTPNILKYHRVSQQKDLQLVKVNTTKVTWEESCFDITPLKVSLILFIHRGEDNNAERWERLSSDCQEEGDMRQMTWHTSKGTLPETTNPPTSLSVIKGKIYDSLHLQSFPLSPCLLAHYLSELRLSGWMCQPTFLTLQWVDEISPEWHFHQATYCLDLLQLVPFVGVNIASVHFSHPALKWQRAGWMAATPKATMSKWVTL